MCMKTAVEMVLHERSKKPSSSREFSKVSESLIDTVDAARRELRHHRITVKGSPFHLL